MRRWVQKGEDGAYILHTDNPEFFGGCSNAANEAGNFSALPGASADLSDGVQALLRSEARREFGFPRS